MDIEKIKNKYEEMPIEELALFLESYDKNDFTKEAQEIINKVLEKGRKNLMNMKNRWLVMKILVT